MSVAAWLKRKFRVVDLEVYENLELQFRHLELGVHRVHFLLQQAPVMDLPMDKQRLGKVGTKFAYVNPKTFSKVTGNAPTVNNEGRIGPGATRWILTPALLEGTVIFSNNAMPGVPNA